MWGYVKEVGGWRVRNGGWENEEWGEIGGSVGLCEGSWGGGE